MGGGGCCGFLAGKAGGGGPELRSAVLDSIMVGGGGGNGLPTIDPTFLGKVLDRVKPGAGVRLVTGESGAEPFLMFFLGGATGALKPVSPLGGRGGLIGDSPMAFLT